MRSHRKSEELLERRKHALDLLESGKRVKEVARIVGVTDRSVRYWQKKAKEPKEKSGIRPAGRPSHLSNEQLEELKQELLQGAAKQGYSQDYWTLNRITVLIWDKFRVRYHPGSIWYLVKRIGWRNEHPQRQKLQRNQDWKEIYKAYLDKKSGALDATPTLEDGGASAVELD